MTDQASEDTTDVRLCAFPAGCSRPVKAREPGKSGARAKYCDDPDHTSLKALRWREANGKDERSKPAGHVVPDDLSSLPHSAALAEAQVTETSLRSLMTQLLEVLPQHRAAVEAAGDPELASVQVANAQAAAQLRVAEAATKYGTEHELRLAAESEQERLQGLLEEAQEAATEADELRGQAEAQKEEAAAAAAAMLVLAALSVRHQQAAERASAEAVAAADRRVEEVQESTRAEIERITAETNGQIEAARTAADEQIEEHRAQFEKDATEKITAARKDAEDKVAAAQKEVETIERTTRERVEKLQVETAQHKATAEAATTQLADAKRERKDLIQEHLTDRGNLIKQHNDERDELVKRHNADRDRLLEELRQSREFGTAQAAAAERTEKARKALETQVRRLERQPKPSSGKGGKSSSAASPADDGHGREQVTAAVAEDEPIPGQSLIVDDHGKPVQSGGEGDVQ
ncbi:hypothetical protein ABZT27_33200 [Streptomyces sp. NPDC005389]|uniref:hypothetical protein n=1 Tax=Streptomyces sp. NPDC005389 TaxID=3157040 RepID=UPI0033A9EF47